jgi:hypothetical protein
MVAYKENFIQQKQSCEFISFFNLLTNFMFSNDQTFHIIFASAMRRDYLVYPMMIGAQPGIIWSYNDSNIISTFDSVNPLHVSSNQCNNLSICLWYVSPLHPLNDSLGTQYALLGEKNKWTTVSQQRFTSIVKDTENNQVTITIQGVSSEIVPVSVFHSTLLSVTVNCPISATTSQAQLVITLSNVICSSIE